MVELLVANEVVGSSNLLSRSIFNGKLKARWQSGHAADCNSVYAGSIPTRASIAC